MQCVAVYRVYLCVYRVYLCVCARVLSLEMPIERNIRQMFSEIIFNEMFVSLDFGETSKQSRRELERERGDKGGRDRDSA